MIRLLLSIFLLFSATACVSPVALHQQIPKTDYGVTDTTLISVIDQRQCLKEGKPNDYIGVAHATFGIPVDWKINPILAVEEGDKKRTLSEFLQFRIVNGLNSSGWKSKPVNLSELPNDIEVKRLLIENNAKNLITLKLNKWFFSLNLNRVSAFIFETNTDISVQTLNENVVFSKNITERDVVKEDPKQSYQNLILLAYKEQLNQIFSDPELQTSIFK